MATLEDIAVSAALNILTTFIMLIAFAILRIQPLNDRVYFSKWYRKGRESPKHGGASVRKFVNLDCRSYIRFLNWIPAALKMTEPKLIEHAGLDSAVYLRIYLMGLKIFVPIAVLACAVLAPVNFTNSTLGKNIRAMEGSGLILRWRTSLPSGTCYVLMEEYGKIASMRSQFIATGRRRPHQFTVLVRNVPPEQDKSVKDVVERFFLENHPDHYLKHESVYNANKLAKMVKEKKRLQNWLDYYQNKRERNNSKGPVMIKIDEERKGVSNDPQSIMPAAFVSFKTRWGAAVCAQTQQTRNPTEWIRRLIIGVAFFFLTLFFMIPIAFVQSLASIEGIAKAAPFLKPIVKIKFIKSVIQGFLPGVVLKLFLVFLRKILTSMSKFEGFVSLSSLQRRTASRYYLFNFVNVFLGSIITGSAFEQLNSFIKEPANDIPKTIGVAIPIKATFFITYIMVDGWAWCSCRDFNVETTDYLPLEEFLLGLVYATVTPLLLPFIIVFFALAYVVFRHQVINVYKQKYESGAAFWPDVHKRVIAALVMSQLLLMGLLSTKEAAQSTPFLIALPVLTIWFHRFSTGLYESAFVKYPLQEAMTKDTFERAQEPNINLNGYLQKAYIHPVFKTDDEDEGEDEDEDEDEDDMLPKQRQSRRKTPLPSEISGCILTISLFARHCSRKLRALILFKTYTFLSTFELCTSNQ
ncbi:hypothetical protein Patl1_09953 [Pistacia atlantica]|uniref:Uncharacterized protein n=1 Tax=Pistacia atlantica TaxID=434234 RepID=A0ACC1A1T4_9ROSI|nr:hypothetical protein Patl1_09953 [Pistacia atlantica]